MILYTILVKSLRRRRSTSSNIPDRHHQHHQNKRKDFIILKGGGRSSSSLKLLPFAFVIAFLFVVVSVNFNNNINNNINIINYNNNVDYYYNNTNNNTVVEHQIELFAYYQDDEDGGDGKNNNYVKRLTSWDDFHRSKSSNNMMILHDNKLNSTGKIVNIGIAHHKGLLHKGIWIAILRPSTSPSSLPNNDPSTTTTGSAVSSSSSSNPVNVTTTTTMKMMEILLLKRGPTLKTCPSAWGLVGEHSDPGESWEATAIRALQEEVQLDLSSISSSSPSSLYSNTTTTTTTLLKYYQLINLLPGRSSFLVKTHYTNVNKYELQATTIFAIVIPRDQLLKFDNEVAEIQWIPIEDVLMKVNNNTCCNDDIYELLTEVHKRIIDDRRRKNDYSPILAR